MATPSTGPLAQLAEAVLHRVQVSALVFILQRVIRYRRSVCFARFEQQGEDVGNQYRTGIYWTVPADETVVRSELDKLQSAWEAPIVVEACPLESFYPAEEYHQKYLDKNPGGYCHVPWEEIHWVKTVDVSKI